jgi:hypothetical protein
MQAPARFCSLLDAAEKGDLEHTISVEAPGGATNMGYVTMTQLELAPAVLVCAMLALPRVATSQVTTAIPLTLTTPDKVESRIGTLEFKDGVPSKVTAEKLYDNLDFTYAFRAFMDYMRGVSIHALRKGM